MTNPDIKQALGYVLCEPTNDGVKLSADGVDITEEIGGGLSLVSGGGINITWDGSTEGRDTFDLIGMSLYKVAGGFLSVDELTGCELTLNDSTTYTLDEELISIVVPNKLISCGDSIVSCIAGTYELPVSASEVATIIIPSDGVYFMEVETHGQVLRPTSLTKSVPSKLMQNGEDVTQEVKEVVGGGGATVVTFTLATEGDTQTLTADMTPAQVLTAMENSPVVGVLTGEDEGVSYRIPFGVASPLFASGAMAHASVIFTGYFSPEEPGIVIVGNTETGWTLGV